MSRLILTTDDGPDFEVDTEDRLAHVEAYSGKTGKGIGYITIYSAGRNHLIYQVDKTRPEGKNRRAWVLNRAAAHEKGETLAGQVLRLAGSTPAVKAALRKAQMDGLEVTQSPSKVEVV